MEATGIRIVGVGVSFVVILVSGIWLGRSGKPYSTALFTVHKLVGLALGVLLGMIVYGAQQAAPLVPLEIAAIAATILLFIVTVAAGGLLSIDRPAPAVARVLHRVVPGLAVLSTAGTLYLLLSGA